jgi:hypothetical protein
VVPGETLEQAASQPAPSTTPAWASSRASRLRRRGWRTGVWESGEGKPG